ncbi:MAG: FecR family protein [Bacteroidetes bacterium]|nr:FecR family protein [Bacteroidota bacterium]
MFLPENIHRIAPLILKYLRDELNDEEEVRLNEWASESERNRVFLRNISEEKILKIVADYNEQAIWNKIQNRISKPVVAEPAVEYRRPFYKRYAAAAGILIVLGGASWLIWNNSRKPEQKNIVVSVYKNDVAPGRSKATLTLANGSVVTLDTAEQGKIIQEGDAKILKTENGQLAYTLDPSVILRNREILFNTVATPRGGQYQLLLADGSRVWLNAASSLKYPVYFTGKERSVELTGEAYFEVAKNPKMPFKVKVNGMEVQVLGTHFNVMAYTDEREIRTTLLEGSVKIIKGDENSLLKPGQQSVVDENGSMKTIDNQNLDEVVSWQKGIFQFTNSDVKTIMRQAARWYDVDVSYEGDIPDHFNATIPRNVSVSKLFEILELTGHIHFKIDGKKVIVLP